MKTQKVGFMQRKHFFINKEFQSKFIIKFCLLITLACFLFGSLVYILSFKTTTTTFEGSRLVIKSTADYLLPLLSLTSMITIIVIGLATIVTILLISHKIAGPAYRFEKVVAAIADGDLNFDVRLRSKDQLQPIAKALNEMLKKWKLQISKIRDKISELTDCIDKIKGSKDEELKTQIAELSKITDELKKEIKYFKV